MSGETKIVYKETAGQVILEENEAEILSDWFLEDRFEAVKLFWKVGFLPTDIRRKELVFGQEKEAVKYLLTKEQYEQRKMKQEI